MFLMKTGYRVGDAMTYYPITVSPDTSILECAKLMEKHVIGSLLVTEENELKGIITEFDIVRKIVAKGKDPNALRARDVMVTRLVTITPDKDIYEAVGSIQQYDDFNLHKLKKMFEVVEVQSFRAKQGEMPILTHERVEEIRKRALGGKNGTKN